ncbi:hypothetical protein HD806DRAFT_56583 [Xylariaceae sp. AK1471]|nr:hypothetical protein HD806DRAFT_56583 [Xylariaceae sp. AK1471]
MLLLLQWPCGWLHDSPHDSPPPIMSAFPILTFTFHVMIRLRSPVRRSSGNICISVYLWMKMMSVYDILLRCCPASGGVLMCVAAFFRFII